MIKYFLKLYPNQIQTQVPKKSKTPNPKSNQSFYWVDMSVIHYTYYAISDFFQYVLSISDE